MPINYGKIPTTDLEAMKIGDIGKVSTKTLMLLKEGSPTANPSTQPDSTPEWAGRHPNLYGVYGAGKELLRTGIETAGVTGGEVLGAMIPVPGATLAGGGMGFAAAKRGAQKLFGEPIDTSAGSIGIDVVTGAAQAGVGKLIGMIPGVKRVLSPKALSVGTKPESVVGREMLDKAAYATMEKSMKVPPSVKQAVREKAINTALKENIPVTKGGLNRVKGMLDDLEGKMDAAVAANPDAPIQIDSVLTPVAELRDWLTKTVNGNKMAKQLDGVVKSFKKQYGDVITVSQAQEIKQNTNALLRKSYGELKPVTEETTKQIVRGLKDRIAQEIPEISGINAKYGDLKNFETALERAVNRTGNWDWFSLSAGMAGTVVGGSTGSLLKATEAVGMWRLLKSPIVQSQLAIMLKNAGKGKEANAMANLITNTVYNKMAQPQ